MPAASDFFISYDADPFSALIIAESDADARDTIEALELVGIRQCGRIRFGDAATSLTDHGGLDLIVMEAAAAPDALLDAVFARTDAIARERRLCIVATISPEQIDTAAAQLMSPAAQLLCKPTRADRVAALAIARAHARQLSEARVHAPIFDASREAEAARIQRLNEEVARIADVLAQLTRGQEAEARRGVRAPGADYRGPDEGPPAAASAQEIRAAIRSRRLRGQFFASELFADPAWDMLLDLFAAHLERRRVSVSSLCIAAAVPPTTALRWIANLHDAGLFERQADPSDRRRAYIGLSPKGLEGMRGYIAAAKRHGLGLV